MFMESNIDDLRFIRSTMERSSKFLTLSGISGVAAGIVAIIGAFFAYKIVYSDLSFTGNSLIDMIIVATVVLVLAVGLGFYFSLRKAKQVGEKLWNSITIQIFKDGCIPLLAGGIFCFILIVDHSSHLVTASMLVFYGLALINFGARSYRDIRILGACEIVLGVIAGFLPEYGLLLWTVGFGILHIIYGTFMYLKYDYKRNSSNTD